MFLKLIKSILGIQKTPKNMPKRVHTVRGLSNRPTSSTSRQYRDYEVDPLSSLSNINTSTKHSDTKHHDSSSDSSSDYSSGSSDYGGGGCD
ncbi:hypothetical protein [Providencia sp. PROV089]|uniref:hypothetical protein n=1 Tax=Providencia sp. PROV089 TaxID=2949805 RepID=UPI00234A2122|nr:hypothetical protein [Providencia sp. PROV089]